MMHRKDLAWDTEKVRYLIVLILQSSLNSLVLHANIFAFLPLVEFFCHNCSLSYWHETEMNSAEGREWKSRSLLPQYSSILFVPS